MISNRNSIFLPIALCTLLSACGGGGGSGSDNGGNDNGGNDNTDTGGIDSSITAGGDVAGFIINITDSASEGLNDPTSAPPVGGNPGTTIGEQRLIVVQEAARVWAEALDINTDVVLNIRFDELECDDQSGVIGAASPIDANRRFAGAPSANTWYVSALANNLAGTDLSPGKADIDAFFNSRIGTTGCLGGTDFYYGLDGLSGRKIDLFHTVLHELAHGLGFVSLVEIDTGALFQNRADAFTENLRNGNFTPYSALTDSQRLSSITSLTFWSGSAVSAGIETLNFGAISTFAGEGVMMYTPGVVDEGSSLSHWDTSLQPDELMEPNASGTNIDLLSALDIGAMKDMGWPLDEEADQDGDGLPNVWEVLNGLNPRDNNDAQEDLDGDTLTNEQEFSFGTAANKRDTDGDTLSDADELNIYNTDPLKEDTNGDGVADDEEI